MQSQPARNLRAQGIEQQRSQTILPSDSIHISLHSSPSPTATLGLSKAPLPPPLPVPPPLDGAARMGLTYNVYLNADKIFGCKNCKTHLASHDHIISRNFRGQHGKAYLFEEVVNIAQADAVERNMTTGRHIVRDINCRQCKETVGWKYDKAYEASEKYKEGKFILEAELLCTVY